MIFSRLTDHVRVFRVLFASALKEFAIERDTATENSTDPKLQQGLNVPVIASTLGDSKHQRSH